MSDPQRPCDLCALPVGVKPFRLALPDRTLEFCCDGCLGIYQMLHDIKELAPACGQTDTNDPRRTTR
jgi:hypothetical protein